MWAQARGAVAHPVDVAVGAAGWDVVAVGRADVVGFLADLVEVLVGAEAVGAANLGIHALAEHRG